MTKKELRACIRSIPLTDGYKRTADPAITETVLGSDAFRSARSVFVYLSSDREPDTSEIIKSALSCGKQVFVPLCREGTMYAALISDKTVFCENGFGIKEPCSGFAVAGADPDLCIIPCMAASEDGKRLGHGGGYYDKYLAGRDTIKMCLCFRCFLSDDIPTEKNDIIMDAVVSN